MAAKKKPVDPDVFALLLVDLQKLAWRVDTLEKILANSKSMADAKAWEVQQQYEHHLNMLKHPKPK